MAQSECVALRKGGSVTWPLIGLMMQMADSLMDIGGRLRLEWRPCEENHKKLTNLTNEIEMHMPRLDQKRKKFKMVNPRRVRTSKKVKLVRRRPLGDLPCWSPAPAGGSTAGARQLCCGRRCALCEKQSA